MSLHQAGAWQRQLRHILVIGSMSDVIFLCADWRFQIRIWCATPRFDKKSNNTSKFLVIQQFDVCCWASRHHLVGKRDHATMQQGCMVPNCPAAVWAGYFSFCDQRMPEFFLCPTFRQPRGVSSRWPPEDQQLTSTPCRPDFLHAIPDRWHPRPPLLIPISACCSSILPPRRGVGPDRVQWVSLLNCIPAASRPTFGLVRTRIYLPISQRFPRKSASPANHMSHTSYCTTCCAEGV